MSNIIITEKDKNESFDDIKELLTLSHKNNIDEGILMNSQTLDSDEIKEKIGKDGVCFIAKEKDKLIGTNSIRFIEKNSWYAKGKTPNDIFAAIHPDYQGKHINTLLMNKAFNYLKEKNYSLVTLDTAANNKKAIQIYKHQGFKLVKYTKYKDSNHYSVIMVKWFDICPYSNIYCKYQYYKSKIRTIRKNRGR